MRVPSVGVALGYATGILLGLLAWAIWGLAWLMLVPFKIAEEMRGRRD